MPCIVADDLNDEQIKAFRLADNKVGEVAEWDFDILTEELDDIINIDMTDFAFDLGLEEEEKEVEEDNFEVEVPEEPKAKLGDIYQLGNHRLMCGDSTSIDDVEKLMNGNKADMVFTDPPYGVSYTGGMKIENGKIESNGKKQIKNDALDYENLYRFLYDVFINRCFDNTKPFPYFEKKIQTEFNTNDLNYSDKGVYTYKKNRSF